MADLTDLRAVDQRYQVRDIADDFVKGMQIGQAQQEREEVSFQRALATAEMMRQFKLRKNPPPALVEAYGRLATPSTEPDYLLGKQGKDDMNTIIQHLGFEGAGQVFEKFSTYQREKALKKQTQIPLDMARAQYKLLIDAAPPEEQERLEEALTAYSDSLVKAGITEIDTQVFINSMNAIAGLQRTAESARATEYGAQTREDIALANISSRERIAAANLAIRRQGLAAQIPLWEARTREANAALAKGDRSSFDRVIMSTIDDFVQGNVTKKQMEGKTKKELGGLVRETAGYVKLLAQDVQQQYPGMHPLEALRIAIAEYEIKPVTDKKAAQEQAVRLRDLVYGQPLPGGEEEPVTPPPPGGDEEIAGQFRVQLLSWVAKKIEAGELDYPLSKFVEDAKAIAEQLGVEIGVDDAQLTTMVEGMIREVAASRQQAGAR